MKKKISILSLIFIFVVSSTSLPIAVYYCNMTHIYTFGKCAMEMPSENPDAGTCTQVRINDGSNSSFNNDCCTVKTIDSSIKDNYIISNPDTYSNLHVIAVFAVPVLSNIYNSVSNNSIQIYYNSSPPIYSESPLYITNSILLI